MLEYDRWANHRWLPFVKADESLRPIFIHILKAQTSWFGRVGTPDFEQPESLADQIEANYAAWKSVLTNRDLTETIHYQNLAGVAHSRTVGVIALHVINHGTYHRGQLREMATEGFPETDFIRFAMESQVR